MPRPHPARKDHECSGLHRTRPGAPRRHFARPTRDARASPPSRCPARVQTSRIKVGVVVPIPQEAAGLGDLQVVVTANDTASAQVFCLSLTATL